jgi:hypothetical protein
MNAETRAKELTNELVEASGLRPGAVGWLWDDRAQSAITQALRQAENDKLEEAARVADGWANKELRMFEGLMRAANETEADKRVSAATVSKMVANDIRSLKEPPNA